MPPHCGTVSEARPPHDIAPPSGAMVTWERRQAQHAARSHRMHPPESESTGSAGHGRRRCIGCSKITSPSSVRSTTSGSPTVTDTGGRSSPRWSRSISPAASSSTASHACAVVPASQEYLLAFSCKCRYFCPSCHAKRLVLWGLWLEESLLADVPHRQVVLAVPKRLRPYLLYHRALLGDLSRVAARTITASSARPWVSGASRT